MSIGFRVLKQQRKVAVEWVERYRSVPVANISDSMHRLTAGGASFEYRMSMRTPDVKNMSRLAEHLRRLADVRAFRISPMGD